MKYILFFPLIFAVFYGDQISLKGNQVEKMIKSLYSDSLNTLECYKGYREVLKKNDYSRSVETFSPYSSEYIKTLNQNEFDAYSKEISKFVKVNAYDLFVKPEGKDVFVSNATVSVWCIYSSLDTDSLLSISRSFDGKTIFLNPDSLCSTNALNYLRQFK